MLSLTTRMHGVVDYLVGASLAAAPWLLGFAGDDAATWVPVGVGVVLIAYSLATDYEVGALRRLQMPVHLWLDASAGLLLAISPWLFGFDQRVWIPHLAVGTLLVLLAILSHTIPAYERRRAERAGTATL